MMTAAILMIAAALPGYGSTLLLVTVPGQASDEYRETVHMIAAVMMVVAICAAFAGGYGAA